MRRPRLGSVRVRAALGAAVAAALCFGTGGLWLRHVIYTDRIDATEQTARAEAEGIAAAPGLNSDQYLYIGASSYAVVSSTGRVERATNWLRYYIDERGLRFSAGNPGFINGVATIRLPGSVNGVRAPLDGRTVSLGASMAGDSAIVYVLASPQDAEDAVAAVEPWLEASLPAAVLLVAVVAWVVVGRALRPVEQIRTELARISVSDVSARVPVPPTGDEIARLASTTNSTLELLSTALAKQRQFVADAAHELRSPLAGLRTLVEVASVHGSLDLAAAGYSIERLQRLTEDLLLLARLENTALSRCDIVDLGAIAEEQVAERFDQRFAVSVSGPTLVAGREQELTRMLRNLLDNAGRYARTSVVVTVSLSAPDRVLLEVRDDGPGVPAADRERVFERFARADEARDREHGGAGLGLAIARDIAVRHGGTLVATGSSFVASFQVASAHLG